MLPTAQTLDRITHEPPEVGFTNPRRLGCLGKRPGTLDRVKPAPERLMRNSRAEPAAMKARGHGRNMLDALERCEFENRPQMAGNARQCSGSIRTVG